MQRTSTSCKSWDGALEDAGSSWRGFGILTLIEHGHWSLTHPWSKFWLSLDFEAAKNIHVLSVLIWGFGGCWRILTGVLRLDLYFDMVTGLWLGPRRMCKVPDWGLGSWIWLGYLLLLVFDTHITWILALYLDLEGAKNIHVLSVLIWGFGGCWRVLTGV